jgi:hypothetical protein
LLSELRDAQRVAQQLNISIAELARQSVTPQSLDRVPDLSGGIEKRISRAKTNLSPEQDCMLVETAVKKMYTSSSLLRTVFTDHVSRVDTQPAIFTQHLKRVPNYMPLPPVEKLNDRPYNK